MGRGLPAVYCALDTGIGMGVVQGAASLIGTNETVDDKICFFFTNEFVLRILISPLRACRAVAEQAAFAEGSFPHPHDA